MTRSKTMFLPGLALALAGGAFAQGDDCSTASPLTGTGSTAFDTTSLTTTFFDGGGSCGTGSNTLNQDGFWQWSVPTSGDYSIDTFGSSFDTQLNVHAGLGCAATCLGYNDQAGGTNQSEILLTGLTAGDMILIQVGGWQAESGSGVLNITPYTNPCAGNPDDSFEDNDTCATPTVLAAGSYSGLYVTVGDSDFYSLTIPTGMVLDVTETFDSNDCDYNLWDATCGTQLAGANLFNITYTNTTGAPEVVILEAHQWTGAAVPCSDYDFTVTYSADPCLGAADDTFENNDTCSTPTVLTPGSYTNLFVSNADSDFYSVTIPAASILTWNLTFDSNDTDFDVYDATCGTLYGTALGGFTFTTGAAAETIIVNAVNWTGAIQSCSNYDIDVSIALDPCQTAPDDSFEDNDDCSTASTVGNGTYTGLFASLIDPDHYTFCVADGDTVSVDVLYLVANGDIDAFLWDSTDPNCGTGFGTTALATGYSSLDNENLVWTNTTGATVTVVCEVNVWTGSLQTCNNYDLVVSGSSACGSTGTGTPFCSPMNPNSTGASTTLTGSMGSGVGSGLHLEAGSGPPNQFGYFLIGTGASDPGIAVSQGRLCLSISGGNVFGRYNVPGGAFNSVGLFNAGGVLINFVGTSTVGSGYDVPTVVPITGSPSIVAGSTWHFQLWHREAGGASNFSNGLSVNF